MKDEKDNSSSSGREFESTHIEFNDPRLFRDLLGQHDQHIKILQQALQVRIRVRGSSLEVHGDPPDVDGHLQLGGDPRREDAPFLERPVIVTNEGVGRVVIGRLGGERRPQFANNRNEIRRLAHRSPLVGVFVGGRG